MTEKMTYRTALGYVVTNFGENLPADVKAKIDALYAKYEPKEGAERKPTKTQKENEGIKTTIFQFMQENKFYTATEIYKALDETLSSVQKATALLGQLANDKLIERVVDKRKTYFVKR